MRGVQGLLWRRCDNTAARDCALPAGISNAPPWTHMAPGNCTLHFLNSSEKSFFNSSHLSYSDSRSGPSLRYWTGEHYVEIHH